MTDFDDDLPILPFGQRDRFPSDCIDGDLYAHDWKPISFVFETQLLDPEGRVAVRQPDIDKGRVYVVCMKCHQHSYIVTRWVGFYVDSPLDRGNS